MAAALILLPRQEYDNFLAACDKFRDTQRFSSFSMDREFSLIMGRAASLVMNDGIHCFSLEPDFFHWDR